MSRHGAVYRRPRGANGGFAGVVEYPMCPRWLAELSHPDQLAPSLRSQIIRGTQDRFGYTASGSQLDIFLDLDEHRKSTGYARFATHAP